MRRTEYNNLKQKCLENNINYLTASTYRYRHPELSDIMIIEYYKQKSAETKSLKQRWFEANISYDMASAYKKDIKI